MFFGLMLMTVMFGTLLIAIPGLISWYLPMPMEFIGILFIVGVVIEMVGICLLWMRLNRTGAMYLVKPARPGFPTWFYIYRDGEVQIVGSERSGEGYLFSRELDALIPDLKTYSLADHKVRFVPEGSAHAVDLEMVEYAQLIDRKHKFKSLKNARNVIFRKEGAMYE